MMPWSRRRAQDSTPSDTSSIPREPHCYLAEWRSLAAAGLLLPAPPPDVIARPACVPRLTMAGEVEADGARHCAGRARHVGPGAVRALREDGSEGGDLAD